MIRWRYSFASLLMFVTLVTDTETFADNKLFPYATWPGPQEPAKDQRVQPEKREKLRKAVSLPRICVLVGYGVNRRGNFRSSAEIMPGPDQMAASEKELKGDATDAERYYRLADLYSRAGQPVKAKEASVKAVELFQKQLEEQPEDPVIQLRLADLLDGIEKTVEAEALLRRAVKDHPNDWHAWLALGELLDFKSSRAIIGRKSLRSVGPESLLQSMRTAQPTPEKIAASQQLRREAVCCYDRAVSLAPAEAEVYRRRGASRYHYGFLDCGLRLYKGERVDFYDCVFGREALPDLRRAVQLNPQDYKGIAFVYFMEIVAVAQAHHLSNRSDKEPDKLIDILSQSTRKRVLKEIGCLEKGIQDPDKDKAAEAAEVLGYLQLFLFADYSAAEKSARRCLELDPKREAAWDLLVNSLVGAEKYRKLADVCRERLEHKDTARNRLMLAKAYDYLHQIDKAEEVVRAGLRREPDDFMLRLALADLLLMRGDYESLKEAGKLLGKLSGERLPDGGSENRWANYAFACGIYGGLIGKTEQAREWLKGLQKRHPKYSGLEDALKALEE